MPIVEYAAGTGYDVGLNAAPQVFPAGLTVSAGLSYSGTGDGYWGGYLAAGWGASFFSVDGAGYRTETGLVPLSASEDNLALMKEAKGVVDEYLEKLNSDRQKVLNIKGGGSMGKYREGRAEDLMEEIDDYNEVSCMLESAISDMEDEIDKDKSGE